MQQEKVTNLNINNEIIHNISSQSNQIISSSHIEGEDINSSIRVQPFIFEVQNPLIPPTYTNSIEKEKLNKKISFKNSNPKLNKNVNVVIVERNTINVNNNSPTRNSMKMYIEENDIEISMNGMIFRPEEEEEKNNQFLSKKYNDKYNEKNELILHNENFIKINLDLHNEDFNLNDNNDDKIIENCNLNISNENNKSNDSSSNIFSFKKEEEAEKSVIENIIENPNIPNNISSIDNFKFDATKSDIRRYKRKDISKGKNYFKYRYISQMLLDTLQNLNSKNTITKTFNQFDMNKVYYSADDKNVIKFTCIFLQKIEKSIFLFNMKKYDDSFNYLKESNIIINEEEFSEILLTIQGFDKFIIGEFLSKEKSPNENFLILNLFINKMNFENEFFLESFRYLLSRINLPKDSSLILNIIDVFSQVYYNDSDNKILFKDINSVYLLACTILALNSMFHCKIPNANIKMMKREEFVKMNKDVDKSLSEKIFEEIKEEKLDIIHDYNELMYRKHLELEDYFVRTMRKSVNNNFYKTDTNTNFNSGLNLNNNNINNCDKNLQFNSEELIQLLKNGETFLKFGKKGDPHERFVFLSDNEEEIIWKSLTCNLFHNERIIKTKFLINVYFGTINSQIFQKNKIPPEDELNCLSILFKKRTLDLKHENQIIIKKWFQAIQYLIKRTISKSEVKNKKIKELSNRKEIISDFWRTQILPNWKEYREFLIPNKRNLNNLNNNQIYKKNLNIKNVINTRKNSISIDDKDKQDVASLWLLGIPDWLRSKIWPLVITNNLEINENLFNFLLRKNENLYTNHEESKKSILIQNSFIDNKNLFKEIRKDVEKCFKKFDDIFLIQNIEEKKFKEELFNILIIFTNYRPDITYSKQIAFIATIFYLNSVDYYQTFIITSNLIISSFLTKFLIKDEIFIKTRCEFFESLLKNYSPGVYKHLKNLDISIRLFFYDWVEFLFTKTFKYNSILRIWDCYIVKGEIFIYELSLSIIKLQEKDIINSTVKGILSNLYFFPDNKYTEDDLFNEVEKIDISEEYKLLIEQDELAKEKTLLYSAFLDY